LFFAAIQVELFNCKKEYLFPTDMGASFSVITPCFNANRWLRCCVASVADQQGVSVQHIVQDGFSTDGTVEYLRSEPRVQAHIQKDDGMYDAINRAWAKCTGEFVVHLNADEELLPGALATAGEYFNKYPEVDVVIGGVVICTPEGELLCSRKPLRPPLSVLITNFHPVQSCAIFLRRSSFEDRPYLYNPNFRFISDGLLMIDIVSGGKHIGLLDRFTSAFFVTGENLGLTSGAKAELEQQQKLASFPRWMIASKKLIRLRFRLSKLFSGQYWQGPLTYAIYTPSSDSVRLQFTVAKPSGVYRPF
jgi:glycosyltransferase involved in cell wall biosynthesis